MSDQIVVKEKAKTSSWCWVCRVKTKWRHRHCLWVDTFSPRLCNPYRQLDTFIYRLNHHISFPKTDKSLWHYTCLAKQKGFVMQSGGLVPSSMRRRWQGIALGVIRHQDPECLDIGMVGLLMLMRLRPCWAILLFCGISSIPYIPMAWSSLFF